MMQRSMKISLVLLWGVFCWCPSVAMITQTPENNMHTTDEPQKTTQQLLINPNVQNKTQTHPTHTPAGADVATQETEKAIFTRSASDDRTSDLAAKEKAAAATTGSSGGRLLHSSAAATTAEAKSRNNMKNGTEHATVNQQSSTTSTNKATPSTNISETATPIGGQSRQQSATTSTNKATPSTNISETATPIGGQSHQQPATTSTNKATPSSVNISETATPTSDQPRQQSATTSTNKATPSSVNISETATPTSDQPRQQPATTSTNKATPSATTPSASLTTAPIIEPTSTTKPEVTTKLPPTNSSTDFTQTPFSTHNQSSPSVSSKATLTENTTSGTAPTTDKSTTGTLALPSSPPTTKTASTSTSERTTGRSNTEPPTTNTTDNATSPAGVLIPKDSKTLPTQTTKSPQTITKSLPSTDPQHCSTRHLVKQSLIAIASLAALATIFMVSTIVLCTKLSSRKYRMKRPKQDTEMMCISSLLPERNYNYSRHRNPPSNGVLVMHMAGDSDEEGGDNLTLSSFLPENDRSV
ncbi:P-selectin glycoprotein ligand 1 [Cheilinus undulatus]|uniref:P-selectin glycoprotein ligand 1 n=1 Tax=Cheilinus undulatus TaxID=241271 RepID=UPI001BD3BD71|nr:P-selectin glycoprotein ligand 1 [Cheilinus undulatus]